MIGGLATYRAFRVTIPDIEAFDDARSIRIYLRFLTDGVTEEEAMRRSLARHPEFLAEWNADSDAPLEEAQTAIATLKKWLDDRGLPL